MSALGKMIEAACKCVKCGAAMRDGCQCWMRLECPRCGKSKSTERMGHEPLNTELVKVCCLECDATGSNVETYYDAQGKMIE